MDPNAVQLLDHVGDRMETGAVQFGDDWPGVFIRGDNATYLGINLLAFLSGEEPHPFVKPILIGLGELLLSANVNPEMRERGAALLASLRDKQVPS